MYVPKLRLLFGAAIKTTDQEVRRASALAECWFSSPIGELVSSDALILSSSFLDFSENMDTVYLVKREGVCDDELNDLPQLLHPVLEPKRDSATH